MDDSATAKTRSETSPLPLEASVDGADLRWGLAWLAQTDQELGLCEAIAEHVLEWRQGLSVRHSLLRPLCPRAYRIAYG